MDRASLVDRIQKEIYHVESLATNLPTKRRSEVLSLLEVANVLIEALDHKAEVPPQVLEDLTNRQPLWNVLLRKLRSERQPVVLWATNLVDDLRTALRDIGVK